MLVGEVFARMGLDSKQYEKDLSRLEGVTRREATTLGAVFKNAFSVALGIGVFEAVKRGFQTIASTAISFNAQMEMARIGFTTMLGSAERAEAFLRDMADFAARTPFEFPELLDASKRMLAYGFAAENVLPTMEAVGNASAAVGLGAQGINRIILALGQIRAKGKLSAEEMRQLTETGIPAWEMLADAMGKTTAEIMDMQQKGLIPAHDAIQMIIEGMNKRFPGMMKKMENTWEGVTSTIKDVWRMTIGTMTAGLFDGLKTWLQGVRDWAVDFYNVLQSQGLRAALTHSFGAEFTSAVYLAGSVLRGFYNILVYVVALVRRHWQLIKFAGTAMLTYAAATKAAAAATSLFVFAQQLLSGNLTVNTGLLGFLSNVIVYYRVLMLEAGVSTNIFTGALMRLRAALYAVHIALGPIGWVLIGLSLLVAGGLHLWNKYTQSLQKTPKINNQVEDSTTSVNRAIKDQAEALKAAGKAAAKNLQAFDELHVLQEDRTGGIGTDFLDAIGDALAGIDAGISMPPIDFDEFLESLEEVKPTFKGFLGYLREEAKKFLENKWSPLVLGLLVSPFAGAIHYIIQNWDEIKAKISAKISEIKTNLATKWSEIKTNTLTKISEIKTGISTKFNEIKNNISTKINEIKTKLSDTWNSIKISAGSAWDGIKNSIRGAINSIIGYINKFIKGFNKIKIEIPSVTLPFYGKVGGWSLKLPQIPEIPTLARGGIIDQPTLAMIGERGKEAVLPLEQNTGWMDALANNIASAVGTAVLQAMQFAGGGSSQGSERELVIEMDGIKVARVLLPKLDREAQRMGMAILKPV